MHVTCGVRVRHRVGWLPKYKRPCEYGRRACRTRADETTGFGWVSTGIGDDNSAHVSQFAGTHPVNAVPAWAWPTTRRENATWSVRLGRVSHWVFAGLAAAILAASIWAALFQTRSQGAAERAIEAWESKYRADRPIYKLWSIDREAYYVSDPKGRGMPSARDWLDATIAARNTPSALVPPIDPAATPAPFQIIEDRPNEFVPNFSLSLFLLVLAALMALAGRGARYVIAGE